jgi:hypothetical protein
MFQEWLALMISSLQQLWAAIVNRLPGVLAALLLLLIGMVVARGARASVEKFFKFAHVDEYTERIKLNELLSHLGFGRSSAYVVGFLVYWLLILVFLVAAADAVQLTVVSQLLERFVLFIPKIIGAVLVLAGGLLVGHFLSEIVQNAAAANEIQGGAALSKIARFVVMVFAAIMALEQIGLDTTIVASSVQIIMGTIGLGLAIAFGLGGRDAAAEIVKNFTRSRSGGGN